MDVEIFRRETPTDAHWEAMRKLLVDYNRNRMGGPSPKLDVVFGLRDPGGAEIGGGLWGDIYWNWLTIYLLVIPETVRRRGVGSALLRKAEAIARENGCVGVRLDTFSFQAPEFYRKHGYETFGELITYPGAHSRIFLQKRLIA